MVCNNCGNSNAETSRFCENCGADLSSASVNQSSTQMNNQGINNGQVYQKRNNNNSKIIIAIIVAIIAIGGIFAAINDYKSKNVSKKTIKNDFIGHSVNLGSMYIEVNEENLKSIDLGEKKITVDFGMKFYQNQGTMVLETDKYKIELPIEVAYLYNPNSKEWMLESNSMKTSWDNENIKIEIKEEITEDIIKAALIDSEVDGLIITDEVANDLKINSWEDDKEGSCSIYATIENNSNFVTKQINFESRVDFNGENWAFGGRNIVLGKGTTITQPSSDITVDEIKESLKVLTDNKNIYGYSGYKSIEVSLDDINSIENLEVDSIKGTNYIINADIAGESGVLAFDGKIEIEVSNDNHYVDCEIEFDNISLENPTEDHLKEEVSGGELKVWIDKKSYFHLITDKDIENLKINEIFNDKDDPFTKHVYVNMTYTEQGKTITSDLIYIRMNYSDSETGWQITKMYSSTDTSFARYYGKDVINK